MSSQENKNSQSEDREYSTPLNSEELLEFTSINFFKQMEEKFPIPISQNKVQENQNLF